MRWGILRALLARLATDTLIAEIREAEELFAFVLALPLLGHPFGPPLSVGLEVLEERTLEGLLEREAFYEFAESLQFDV